MRNPLFAMLAAGQRPSRGIHTVHREAVIPASVDETFAFFAEATNLERLTPPWINFRIRTPLPIVMREGAVIDYRIGLYGRADSVADADRRMGTRGAIRGPSGRGAVPLVAPRAPLRGRGDGTRVVDHVEFAPRAAAMTARLVARDVRRIFG